MRQQLVEEVGRMFGVPRPFLMLDDTSWGSGIEQLSMMLVQYTLAPWFVSWEQAISVCLLSEAERDRYRPKFNEKALLRGTMKDQAEFLSKLTGAGGTVEFIDQFRKSGYVHQYSLDVQREISGGCPVQVADSEQLVG